MSEIKVPKFDDFFKLAGEALSAAEEMRAGLQDAKENCMVITGCHTIKDATLTDAFTCWLWSATQELGGGDVIKPKFSLTAPHVSLEMPEVGLSADNKEFMDSFKVYCECIFSAPTKIPEILTKLQEFTEKANEMKGTAAEDFKAAGLGMQDNLKALKNIATNIGNLGKGVAKLSGLVEPAASGVKSFGDLATALPAILLEAAKNGKEGIEKGAKTAAEMAAKQHTGTKLTDIELKKLTVVASYEKRKAAGKKTGGKEGTDAAPAASPAAAADGGAEAVAPVDAVVEEKPQEEVVVKPEDVEPEVKEEAVEQDP